MKKYILISSLILIMISCVGNNEKILYYKAISIDKKDTAYLKIIVNDNNFYGDYKVNYADKTKDRGTIRGSFYGDTLKAKYTFISRHNSKALKPLIFLKDNDNLKLGTGVIATYMAIPFYMHGTIKFNDSLFQFVPYLP